VHPAPLPPRSHNACLSEIGQVARDFRLADAQNLHKIADANFPVGDEIEQAQASAIGQCAKEKIEGQ